MAAANNRARKRWWTSIGVGALACVGCCVVVPLLATAGIAGSGILLVGARWLEPLGFALIAIGIVGVLGSQIRAYRRRGADTCQCTRPNTITGCRCRRSQPAAPPAPDHVS
ncbi:hypothetical protein [Mycolicibacterium sp.]|uniref:hypothetical protein n=1 Tax=Mycolicibacterium sp. TaxID=2320850 RepID=UPI00114EF332|nr:hypothetical protein [Mycobacterium sp. DSM 3803]